MISHLSEALRLAELGWYVFPTNPDKSPRTKNGLHAATTNTMQITAWWTKWPKAGIAVATGQKSGIVVLDVDLNKEGADASFAQIVRDRGHFDESVSSRTGGGGRHIFFRYPDTHVGNAQKLFNLVGIDVRGDGGYVVLPPSLHDSGKQYVWEEGRSPFENSLPECPTFLYEENRKSTLSFDMSLPIPEGERNATLASIAGLLRTFGLDEDAIYIVLSQQNDTRCIPPLDSGEVRSIAHHMSKSPPRRNRPGDSETNNPAIEELLRFPRNDLGFSQMIAATNVGILKFNHDMSSWLVWDKYWWSVDKTSRILQKAIETTELLREISAGIEDDDAREDALKYVSRIQNKSKIDAALALAKSHDGIATRHFEWNRQPMLLGVRNGVVDLCKGKIIEPDPEALISTHLDIDYQSAKPPTRWLRFLDEIFEGRKDVISFVQRAIGYTLTGDTSEQCFFLLVGTGANGKSVFLHTLRTLMGEYAVSSPFSTFLRGSNPSLSNDLAMISGRRLVVASEANESTSFDEARIKTITGGETISARFLHQEFFEFRPICKIWLSVNHLPTVRDDSEGFWRRVRRIDFPHEFRGSEKDPHLAETLEAELPGILAWAVEGSLLWQKQGLTPPQSIESSTHGYREKSDILAPFYQECCKFGETEVVADDDLYRAYRNWGTARLMSSFEMLRTARFFDRVERAFPSTKKSGKTYFIGLSLVDSAKVTPNSMSIRLPERRKKGTSQ